jgi:hypothetical protein
LGQPGQSQKYSVSASSRPSEVFSPDLMVTGGMALLTIIKGKKDARRQRAKRAITRGDFDALRLIL